MAFSPFLLGRPQPQQPGLSLPQQNFYQGFNPQNPAGQLPPQGQIGGGIWGQQAQPVVPQGPYSTLGGNRGAIQTFGPQPIGNMPFSPIARGGVPLRTLSQAR